MLKKLLLTIPLLSFAWFAFSQSGTPTPPPSSSAPEEKLGAWYMYFWNTTFNDGPWGVQGDFQYRLYEIFEDKEQLLLRSGLTYQPLNTKVKFTLGYAYINSGTQGPSTVNTEEHRIYQEALIPHRIGRVFFTHRFRYEQRWVENSDFRTRYRYNIFINVPFNQTTLDKGAVYLAFYNEVFLNGKRMVNETTELPVFDQNRLYFALGYSIKDNLRTQLGYMVQSTRIKDNGQIQLSLHHSF